MSLDCIRAWMPVSVLFYQDFESFLNSGSLGKLARLLRYIEIDYLSVEKLCFHIHKEVFPTSKVGLYVLDYNPIPPLIGNLLCRLSK